MNIKEILVILLCSFGFLIGFQLGRENISIWITFLVSFGSGLLGFVLLNKFIGDKK